MSEFLSRVWLATEAAVICAPLTAVIALGVLPEQIHQVVGLRNHDALAAMAAALFMLAGLACLWRLIAVFVSQGSDALRRVSVHLWMLPIASAALAVRMAAYAWSAAVTEPSWLGELGWGVPLLVPLLHLCIERGLRSDARGAVRRHVGARLDKPYT